MSQQDEEKEEYLNIRKSEFASVCSELSQVRKRLEELEKSQQ
jgi:hypothetical protein